jgi:hypothetical protein
MTHAEFARETVCAYVEWRETELRTAVGGRHTPEGWNSHLERGTISVWGPGDDWHHPPFRANAVAILRELRDAERGAQQLSLF